MNLVTFVKISSSTLTVRASTCLLDPARNQLFDLFNKLIQDKSRPLSIQSLALGPGGQGQLGLVESPIQNIQQSKSCLFFRDFFGSTSASPSAPTEWSCSRRVCQGPALPKVGSSEEVLGQSSTRGH